MIRYLALLGCTSFLYAVSMPVPVCHAAPVSGLKELVAFNDSAQERLLQFDLASQARCMFGDLDVILLDMKYARGALRLQLTVEALGGAAEEVYYGRPLEQKTARDNLGTYEVKLPGSSQPRLCGVFVCSVNEAQAGRVPCSRHKLLTFDEMMTPYKADSSGLKPGSTAQSKPFYGPKAVEPKTYFAQFFVSGTAALGMVSDIR
jgi:hypothetical protein